MTLSIASAVIEIAVMPGSVSVIGDAGAPSSLLPCRIRVAPSQVPYAWTVMSENLPTGYHEPLKFVEVNGVHVIQ